MIQIPKAQFSEFIDFFPLLETPFSLLPDIHQIPTNSLPLPGLLLDAFILPFEGEEIDDFTEYIPYGKIAGTKDYYAVIYWKAGLMQYEFILATYSLAGKPLSHAIIAGIRADEHGLLHSVAVFHDDLSITIAEGVASEGDEPDLDQTNTYQMSIQPTGQITYGVNEEDKQE
ncbi:MAG TPA: hypothetical protein VMZ69_07025 [Saprospiraceae bacterium]|nr:hypothetical protein [Saprospiraceae bacterium]